MLTLQECVEFCNKQAAYHERVSTDQKIKPHQVKKHREAAQGLRGVLEYLYSVPAKISEGIASANHVVDSEETNLFDLDPFRLGDIPDEFVEELKISRADKADAQILELFRIAKRPLNISEVLIGLYRKFGQQEKRTALSARLYRLTQGGQLESVEGERGVYKLNEIVIE